MAEGLPVVHGNRGRKTVYFVLVVEAEVEVALPHDRALRYVAVG